MENMIIITKDNLPLCRRWLLLGMYALAVSGILSIAVVFLRLPFASALFSVKNFFDISLVMHVNLSVLVWMCSITSIVISFLVYGSRYSLYFKYLWYLSFFSTLTMTVAIFVPGTEAIKNNYIPVLNNKLFLFGLTLFFTTILSNSLLALKSRDYSRSSCISVGICGVVIIITCAFLCFITAYKAVSLTSSSYDNLQFYEFLFWGGGHLLQLAFSQVLLITYVVMVENSNSSLLKPHVLLGVFILNTVCCLFAPIIYVFYPANSVENIAFFTEHMMFVGALVPLFIIVLTFCNIRYFLQKENRLLLCATFIFVYGGILGALTIDGNVTVPAHYHGSVVGITIAFMGFVYWLLPMLNVNQVKQSVANTQIYLYSLGQFLHITGLEWLGGYGALRKIPSLPTLTSISARVCFVVGGLIAVLGGCLFVIIVLIKVYESRKRF